MALFTPWESVGGGGADKHTHATYSFQALFLHSLVSCRVGVFHYSSKKESSFLSFTFNPLLTAAVRKHVRYNTPPKQFHHVVLSQSSDSLCLALRHERGLEICGNRSAAFHDHCACFVYVTGYVSWSRMTVTVT